MTLDVVEKKLLQAIYKLLDKDSYLIEHDIYEKAISHKLANYLENEFKDFDVDSEFNGYVKADNDRKYIRMLRAEAEALGKLRESDGDSKLIFRAVYPDIIIHHRGGSTEDSNLLIVEMKKATNSSPFEYDKKKLERYTSNEYENNLNYEFGAFVLVKQEPPYFDIDWYASGAFIYSYEHPTQQG